VAGLPFFTALSGQKSQQIPHPVHFFSSTTGQKLRQLPVSYFAELPGSIITAPAVSFVVQPPIYIVTILDKNFK
jgi:hypothetical protein